MNLLLSLGSGAVLIVLVDLLLLRFSRLDAVQCATVTALTALGLYLPYVIIARPSGDVIAIHLAIYLIVAFVTGLFTRIREQSRAQGQPHPRVHWGPAAIIGFFVTLAVVDSIFLLLAERGLSPQLNTLLFPDVGEVSSAFPGVIARDFQKKESLYNDYLLQIERQHQRGWQIRRGWVGPVVAGQPAVFQVAAQTREGEPLTGAEIKGEFLRAADSRLDQTFTMTEAEPGLYRAGLNLPAAGNWELVLVLHKGDDLHEIRARTSVQAAQ